MAKHLDPDDMARVIEEETLGIEPEVEDTPELAAFRERIRPQIEEIEAAGHDVMPPHDWPEFDPDFDPDYAS